MSVLHELPPKRPPLNHLAIEGAAVVQHILLLSTIREYFNCLGAKVKVE